MEKLELILTRNQAETLLRSLEWLVSEAVSPGHEDARVEAAIRVKLSKLLNNQPQS